MDLPDDGKGWRAASDPTSAGPSASYSLSAQVEGLDPGNPAREPAPIKPEPFLERTTWERTTAAREPPPQQAGWTGGRAATGRSQAVDEAAASLTLLPAPGSRVGARYPAGGPADAATCAPQQRPPSFGGAPLRPQPFGFPAFGADRHAAALQYPPHQSQPQQQQQPGGGVSWTMPQHPATVGQPLGSSTAQAERLGLGWNYGFIDLPLAPPSQLSPWGAPSGGFAGVMSAAPRGHPAGDPSAQPIGDGGGGISGAGVALDPLRPTVLIGGLGGGADGDSPRGGSPPPEVMMQHAAALLSLAEFLPDGDDSQAQVPCPTHLQTMHSICAGWPVAHYPPQRRGASGPEIHYAQLLFGGGCAVPSCSLFAAPDRYVAKHS